MRGEEDNSAGRRTRYRIAVPARPRLIVAVLASFALALAFPTIPASATLYHPKPSVASFGPLGGGCSEGHLATGTGTIVSGSNEITSVAASCGSFKTGQEISGTGISGTITAVAAGTVTVSSVATQSGSGVALISSSNFGKVSHVTFGQAPKRLYAVDESFDKLFGFDLSTPEVFAPLGIPFPLSIPIYDGFSGTSLAVDDSGAASQGNIYTAERRGEDVILGYDSSGSPLPGFPIVSPPEPEEKSSPGWTALAVDPSGDVWGGNFRDGEDAVYEYSPAGALLSTVKLPGSEVYSLAFAANGDLYADADGTVWKLSAPTYDDPQPFVEGVLGYLDVDRSNGDVYIAAGNSIYPTKNRVLRYRSDGVLLEEFATGLDAKGVAIDEANGTAYVTAEEHVDVFAAAVLPDLTVAAPTSPTESTVTLNGTVAPGGVALSDCKFEWVTESAYQASGFASLASGGEKSCSPAFGSISTAGTTSVSSSITGLKPGEAYRYRLSGANVNGSITTKGTPASITLAKPGVETVGSPVHTASTVRLDARVDPHGIPTSYHFQYITDAAYQANVSNSLPPFEGASETPSHSAGDGALIELATATVQGLTPGTVYRYRLVADNGAFGGPATGAAMSVTTRASDAPLSHGSFPGPSGSDRAWEQVNLPDTGGNPVYGAAAVADDGDSAVYEVAGGTSLSQAGTGSDYLFARRPVGEHPESGWQTEAVYPARSATKYRSWYPPTADDHLATLLDVNVNLESGTGIAVWRLPTSGGAATKVYEAAPGKYNNPYMFSDDGSRALLILNGSTVDPEHHSPGGVVQLYDVSSGIPHIVSLLPNGAVPSCGVEMDSGSINLLPRGMHWVSTDGSRVFFQTAGTGSCSTVHLYMRDFASTTTTRIDAPATGPVAGPDCPGAFIRSTPEAVFFWTQSDLGAPDTPIASCDGGDGGGDVYRYDLADGSFKCVTCVLAGGAPANVSVSDNFPDRPVETIAVSGDGSRVYFTTQTRLLSGVPETGTPAIYRVDVASGDLAYVGPLAANEQVGENPTGVFAQGASAVSSDGRYLVFASASPALDALTGSDNGRTVQYYVYDDAQRSLLCASCPPDGSAPRGPVSHGVVANAEPGPNTTLLADNGDVAFATPTPLVAADQNTAPAGKNPGAGMDVYEWRDGRALLISDGVSDWPSLEGAQPRVVAITPSGHDLFFTESAALTPDATDGIERLYDARIGGGISFPPAAKPCPLEVCQGTPTGAPEEAMPGSAFFSGSGNLMPPSVLTTTPAKPKGKVLTRAQMLAKALRACEKKSMGKRAACRAEARRRYGAKKARKATPLSRRTVR